MGYTKTFETKIIRTKHRVTFSTGTTKLDLVESLDRVPNDAVVDEVVGDNSEDSNGISYIQFHEEKRDDA